MASLMDLVPLPWRIAAVVVFAVVLGGACGLGAWKGYGAGYSAAAAVGEAALQTEKADRKAEDAARARALADREAGLRQKEQAARNRADGLERQFLEAERVFATERAQLARRIHAISARASADCAGLPAEWVHAFNSAIGAGAATGSGDAGTGVSAAAPGAVPGIAPGLREGQPLTDPADILAFTRDYGALCRRYAAQVNGWQQTYGSWLEQEKPRD